MHLTKSSCDSLTPVGTGDSLKVGGGWANGVWVEYGQSCFCFEMGSR